MVELDATGNVIINGSSDFAVAFNDLKAGFDQLKADFNTHVHAGSSSPAGLCTILSPAASVPPAPSTATIDAAKVESVKLP